jgi:hypothetical protein
MRRFDVYYAAALSLTVQDLTVEGLADTHRFVRSVEAAQLRDVFRLMQGEVWSPNGEARSLIISLGLDHTSMSIGDVAHDVTVDEYWQVDRVGWKKVPKGGANVQ